MPIYEYKCTACDKHHEIMQKITENPLSECPSCGGHLRRLISNTSFVLKGTGWYATDYASDKKNGQKTEETSDKKEKTTETATEQKKDAQSETKPETKETTAAK